MSDQTVIHVITTGETRNPVESLADLDMVVAVGFGSATITHDGEVLFDGDASERRMRMRKDGTWFKDREHPAAARSRRVMRGGFLTLRRVERYLAHRAKSGAPLTGRIECSMYAPLWEATWWRRAPGEWECVTTGEGFA